MRGCLVGARSLTIFFYKASSDRELWTRRWAPGLILRFAVEEALVFHRCRWVATDLNIVYHDREWGVPQHDDRTLFEFLILEGAQAGLSWETILRKRENYRQAFDGFDPAKVARYSAAKVETLMGDAGIVRNRLKVASAITNAQAFLKTQKEFGRFDGYRWGFVGGKPLLAPIDVGTLQTRSAESDALSRDLLRRGFKFVGTTICYALMQAVGLINAHETGCFRRSQVGVGARRETRS